MRGDVQQTAEYLLAHVLVEGTDGADQLHLVGNDVVADAAPDGAEADHHRLPAQVHLPADDVLRRTDNVGRRHDGIDATPGARAVRLPAPDHDAEAVGGGHEGAGTVADLAHAQGREHVQAHDRIGAETVEEAFGPHHARPTVLAVRRYFLSWLEAVETPA